MVLLLELSDIFIDLMLRQAVPLGHRLNLLLQALDLRGNLTLLLDDNLRLLLTAKVDLPHLLFGLPLDLLDELLGMCLDFCMALQSSVLNPLAFVLVFFQLHFQLHSLQLELGNHLLDLETCKTRLSRHLRRVRHPHGRVLRAIG